MIHPDTELRFISPEIGYGVVATKFIPKGTITWTMDKLDRIYTPEQVQQMDKLYQDVLYKYTYRNADGNHVLCWDISRFVNHSSNSNCVTTAYEFELATRDIYPGEELTDDYGYLNLEEPFEVVPEAGTNRHVIYPDDLLRFHSVWDDKLLSAFPLINAVDQPLYQLLSEDVKEKTRRIAAGQQKMDSILNCFCEKNKINGHVAVNGHASRIAYPL